MKIVLPHSSIAKNRKFFYAGIHSNFSNMKRILATLAITFLLLFIVHPLSSADILDNVATGLRAGNSSIIAKFFDTNIDITILDKESVYSKAQAELVLKNFFQKNPVTSFSIIHRGTSAQGSLYGIGNMVTTAQTFRVYYYVKSKNGVYLLQELRFEKQK